MPVYLYKNLNTGETFEIEQRITESALTTHPESGEPVKRLIQPVGIAFKGSGFYVTDSRSSGGRASGGAASEGGKGEGGKADGGSDGAAASGTSGTGDAGGKGGSAGGAKAEGGAKPSSGSSKD